MNRELAMKVANAVLYEGYMLYPYRPSAIKNRQRWSFGILYPPMYPEVGAGTERSEMHSECLVRMTGEATLQIQLRFLHLMSREVAGVTADGFEQVPSLTIDGSVIEPSDEGIERSVECELTLRDAVPQGFPFSFAAMTEAEPLHYANGEVGGEIRRRQKELSGTISVTTTELGSDLVKLTIDVANTSVLSADAADRDAAMLSSLLSAHTILSVMGGEFVSLLDPPENLRSEVSACRNVGNFPVLVGAEGERDMMLCSPIVLYDYPQIAPESAGDFFDGTEMDEMLTLRVMTLTDDEKEQMRAGDDRVRALLQRTEASAREQLMRMHGTIREMRPAPGGEPIIDLWNPEAPENAPPASVTVFGVEVKPGDRVRLWPQKSADIMDMAMKGKVAVVEAIERDYDDQVHLAVVLEDDPGRDLGMLRQPGHRFFFSPEEIEPLTLNGEVKNER